MALRTTLNLPTFSPSPKGNSNSNSHLNLAYKKSPLGFFLRARQARLLRCTRVNGRVIETEDSDGGEEEEYEKGKKNDPFRMNANERREWQRKVHEMMKNGGPAPDDVDEDDIGGDVKYDPSLAPGDEERREWRRTIRETMEKKDEIEIEEDEEERSRKAKQLLSEYPLVVDEEDPDWPDDADGWGFKFDSFFDKITIKNKPKSDDDDNDDDVDKEEIVWQDDNYIRPIKDIVTADWEEAVFKDFSPLVVLVHHRYKRPKESEKAWNLIEKAVNIIWNCRMPSPRCVAVDAVVETDLVSALRVSVFPEIIFTKAGKILYRERAIRTADELSKMMAYFYYGAHKPACLKITGDSQELIPLVTVNT